MSLCLFDVYLFLKYLCLCFWCVVDVKKVDDIVMCILPIFVLLILFEVGLWGIIWAFIVYNI